MHPTRSVTQIHINYLYENHRSHNSHCCNMMLQCLPLNRTIVYLISTPVVSTVRPEDGQRRTEETGHYRGVMQRMQHFSRLIFHPFNASTEFIQCMYVRDARDRFPIQESESMSIAHTHTGVSACGNSLSLIAANCAISQWTCVKR